MTERLTIFKPNMTKIEISLRTILTIAALVLLYFFLARIEYILILIILAYLITTGINPLVKILEKRGINRTVSIFLIYLGFVIIVFAFIFFILVPLFQETVELIRQTPFLLNDLTRKYGWLHSLLSQYNIQLYESISRLSRNATQSFLQGTTGFTTIYRTVLGTFKFVASALSVIVMSIYMLIDKQKNEAFLINVMPDKYKGKVKSILEDMDISLGNWVRAQGILSFIIFILNYIALTLLHIKFALTISLIAGFLEVVPVAGPVIAALIAVVIALLVRPENAIFVLLSSTIIQQIENHLLVPKIMQQVIGVSPLVTIVALLVGAELFGVVGAVLSVPIATIIQIIYLEWQKND